MKRRRGQILILVLLVVVVALAVGLSVASRNITNLRTSTQTEQSQRAFSAAEGGVEDVLSRLSQIVDANRSNIQSGVVENIDVGGITASVNVRGSNIYQATIEEGTVGQIDLAGPPAASGILTVEWAKNSDTIESSQPASIEVTQVYGTSPSYNQTRKAYSGGPFPGRDETGFAPGNCIYTGEFKCRVTMEEEIPANSIVLRIRPFWVKTAVRVTSSGNLPLQTYNVASTATTDLGITRKIEVTRTALPALPAAFDYVLFSEESIVK